MTSSSPARATTSNGRPAWNPGATPTWGRGRCWGPLSWPRWACWSSWVSSACSSSGVGPGPGLRRLTRLHAGDLGVVEQPARDEAFEPLVDGRQRLPAVEGEVRPAHPEPAGRYCALERADGPAEPRGKQFGGRHPDLGGAGPPGEIFQFTRHEGMEV